jgi:hypothetical protein
MCEEPLPPDLRQIEQDLIPLLRFDPQREFGRRISGAVQSEIRRERAAARWKFVLGLAAGAFFWLHLSFYAAPLTDFHFRGAPPAMASNSRGVGPQTGFYNWSPDE